MYLEKSILTTAVLFLCVIVTFTISFSKRKFFLHSIASVCLCYCYYTLFMNTLLPFPLDFVARYQFEGGSNKQFAALFSDNFSFYVSILLISIFIGILTPFVFPKFRKYWHTVVFIFVPILILLFQFCINMAIGGKYKFVDITIVLVFTVGEAAGYGIQKLIAKFVPYSYTVMDRNNKKY